MHHAHSVTAAGQGPTVKGYSVGLLGVSPEDVLLLDRIDGPLHSCLLIQQLLAAFLRELLRLLLICIASSCIKLKFHTLSKSLAPRKSGSNSQHQRNEAAKTWTTSETRR